MAKIGRAKEHLDALKGSIDAFVGEGKAYTITKEVNREAGEFIFRITVRDAPPLVNWSLIIGDCFHNTRTALDHLFWALVMKKNPCGGIKNASAINFPILKDASTFKGRKGKIKDWVGNSALAKLEALQPFNDA